MPIVGSMASPSSMTTFLFETVDEATSKLHAVGKTKMLVSTGWTRGGKVFTFVLPKLGRIAVKLVNEPEERELEALDGTERLRIGKKAPAKNWYLLPESMHDDAEALRLWLGRAYASLPAKPEPKKKKPASKSKARVKKTKR